MPSGTVKESTAPGLLPEGWYLAKLLDVEEKPVGDSTKLKWKWRIIAPEAYAVREDGRDTWAYGECWSDLDQSDHCVWRRWHEALVERQVGIDERIDTDDIKGFMAYIKIGVRSYVKDGQTKWVNEVAQRSYEKDGQTKWAPDPEAVQSSSFVPPENEQPGQMVSDGAWAPESQRPPATAADDPWASPAAQQAVAQAQRLPDEPTF